MKLDIIENHGPDNLRDFLRNRFRQATEVSIAVAFVTQSGLDVLLQSLRQVATPGRVRLITGLYQSVTEPAALRTLLRVQEETRGRFSVRLSMEPQFHRKLYLVRTRSSSIAVVGSSNFTREGLRSGGELNVVLRTPKGSLAGRKLTQAFDEDWEYRSVPLTAEQITEYERCRPKSRSRDTLLKSQFAKILKAAPLHWQADENLESVSHWRDCVTGYVSRKTERIIESTTDWDEKGYLWYSAGTNQYKIGDRIFLFDFADRRVRLIKVTDHCEAKPATPDGKHFVAYLPVHRHTRRFSKQLWQALADEGIGKKNAQSRRKLSIAVADRLSVLLRTTKVAAKSNE